MTNEKTCQNCGAKNQPYAAFCADCGSSFIPSPESPPPVPPPIPPQVEDVEKIPVHEPPIEPAPTFKKRYILYAVLAILSLFVVIAAISASYQANRSIATPSIEASIAATPAPTESLVTTTASTSVSSTAPPSASASPSPSQSTPDYASRLNTIGLGAGLTTVSPFQQVTLSGKTAYVGTLSRNGQTYNTQVYPIGSYSEALTLKDQLISSYQSQGYVAYNPGNVGDASLNIWYGLSGNTLVSVTAMPTSQIGAPLILVMTPT